MPLTTPATELVAAFRLCEAQLKAALYHKKSTRLHAALFRKSNDLLSQIERRAPESRNEFDDLLNFHARRQMELPAGATINLDSLAALLRIDREGLPRLDAPAFRLKPAPASLPDAAEIDDLARFVTRSASRLAALSYDRRFLAVSGAMAALHRSTPGKMMGQHVMEVMGGEAFHDIDGERLQRAFGGEPQDHVWRPEEGAPGGRASRSQMRRVENSSGVPYALLWLVTDDTAEAGAAA